MEFGTTARLAEAAVQAVKFGADRQDAVAKIAKLKERLQALEKVRLWVCGLHGARCMLAAVLSLLSLALHLPRAAPPPAA